MLQSRPEATLTELGIARAMPAGLSRIGTVDVPVPACGGQPPQFGFRVVDRQHGEPADDPLTALVVAVEQFRRPRLVSLDDLPRLFITGAFGVAERPLPESDIAHRDVQIPVLSLELLER